MNSDDDSSVELDSAGLDQSRIRGGGRVARRNLKRFLETRTLNGIDVSLHLNYDDRWDYPYELSFNIPDGNAKYAVMHAGIAVEDWLDLVQSANVPRSEFDRDAFEANATHSTIERVAADIEAGETDDIPTPVLEILPDYTLSYAEGRSRGLGAKRAGLDVMPIWIASQDYR